MNGLEWMVLAYPFIASLMVLVAPLAAPRWGVEPREAMWATVHAIVVFPIALAALVAVLLLLAAA